MPRALAGCANLEAPSVAWFGNTLFFALFIFFGTQMETARQRHPA